MSLHITQKNSQSRDDYDKAVEKEAKNNKDGKYHRSIFIGLGGSGQKALHHLRQRLYERYGRTSLPGMAFLAFDTDVSDQRINQGQRRSPFHEQLEFGKNELLHLKADVQVILNDLSKFPDVQDWFDPDLRVEDNFDLSQGAGQMRPISRLVGLQMYGEIRNRIKLAETKVLKQGQDSDRIITDKIHVYLVAGLAGGTGSGLFLDIAAMVRDAMDNVLLKGYLILPDCYEGVEQKYRKIAANGAAALRELNHFMRQLFCSLS